MCVQVFPVKHEGKMARSTDAFQTEETDLDAKPEWDHTGIQKRKSLRARERAGFGVKREDHRLGKLTVYMSVGLHNYRLAWCVEPKVYHNTAQVMTPRTTHTCRRKYTYTTAITVQSI